MPRRTGANRDEIRRHNLAALLEHLHHTGETSRAELTSLLGLNRSTIGALVADLAARGLVEEVEPAQRRTAGRPSPVVRPRPQRAVALAFEIEVDNVSVALVGIGGTVLARGRATYPAMAPDPEQAIGTAVTLAGPMLGTLDSRGQLNSRGRLIGVGVGVAGIVRRSDGLVHHAPNLGWRDVPLGGLVGQALGFDVVVHVGNDANFGAVAEHTRGAGQDVGDLVYISSEVGIGVGVLAGGRLVVGADGYFGEYGHLPLFPGGRQCRCGARGCWETEVGTHSLLRQAGRSPEDGRAGVREVLAGAARGDRPAVAAVEYVADHLAIGLAAIVNTLNPRLIVLGGFFADLWPLTEGQIRRTLCQHALAAPAERVDIVPTLLGEDAALLGAAETALAPLVHNPTLIPTR